MFLRIKEKNVVEWFTAKNGKADKFISSLHEDHFHIHIHKQQYFKNHKYKQ